MKAQLDKPEKAEELNEAREKLHAAYDKWRPEFAARLKADAEAEAKSATGEKPTPVSTNPDDYLAPIVREMLKRP